MVATWAGPVKVELTKPTVISEGDRAVAFGLSQMRGIKQWEGRVDSCNRQAVVLRRNDGAWRIVHAHKSYPRIMDGSGHLAMDHNP